MLAITLKNVKIAFNQQAILTPTEKFEQKLLQQFGSYCRTVMRNSIRRASRPGQHAHAGQPPLYHDHHGRINYRDTIFFIVDARRREVLIGAVLLHDTASHGQAVPGILEKGGTEIVLKRSGLFRTRQTIQVKEHPHAQPAFEKTIKKKLPDLIAGGIMREA